MYDYREAMKRDITEELADNEYYYTGYDRDELEEKLNEDLWIDDSVTGNASGSYTFNRAEAGEYVGDNLDLAAEAYREFGLDPEELGSDLYDEGYEKIDVTIRCYLLSEIIAEVLDEAEESGYFENEEEA